MLTVSGGDLYGGVREFVLQSMYLVYVDAAGSSVVQRTERALFGWTVLHGCKLCECSTRLLYSVGYCCVLRVSSGLLLVIVQIDEL